MENEYLEKLYREGRRSPLRCDECGENFVQTKEALTSHPEKHEYLCKNEHIIRLTDAGYNLALRQQEGVKRGGEIRTTSATGGQKGTKEARFDLIPPGPLKELAILYGRGALKYSEHNWRKGYEWEKSGASIDRHHNAWRAGFDYDVCSNEPDMCLHELDGVPWTDISQTPDTCYNHTGCHHQVCVAWHAFGLLEFKDRFPQHDNRFRYDPPEQLEIDFNHVAVSSGLDHGELYAMTKALFEAKKNDPPTFLE